MWTFICENAHLQMFERESQCVWWNEGSVGQWMKQKSWIHHPPHSHQPDHNEAGLALMHMHDIQRIFKWDRCYLAKKQQHAEQIRWICMNMWRYQNVSVRESAVCLSVCWDWFCSGFVLVSCVESHQSSAQLDPELKINMHWIRGAAREKNTVK